MRAGFYEQNARRRQQPGGGTHQRNNEPGEVGTMYEDPSNEMKNNQWKRILLLVVAITVSGFSSALSLYVAVGNGWVLIC